MNGSNVGIKSVFTKTILLISLLMASITKIQDEHTAISVRLGGGRFKEL